MLQELLWQISRNVDVEATKTQRLHFRSPFLEVNCLFPGEVSLEEMEKLGLPADVVDDVNKMPRDEIRVIKTHLPFDLLPQNLLEVAKGIYIS